MRYQPRTRLVVVASAALSLSAGLALLGLIALGTFASHADVNTVAIDMDSTGNTATAVGTTQDCAFAPVGIPSTLTFDVVLKGVPPEALNGDRMNVAEVHIGYDDPA